MPLLEPITFISAPVSGENIPRHVIPEEAEDMPLRLFSPSPDTLSMTHSPQPLVIPSGINSLSRSDPPTPPRGPPPTPRRRVHNELSKSDPPTPPRAPPPTPRRRGVEIFSALSCRDSLNGPPLDLHLYEADIYHSLPRHGSPSSLVGSQSTASRSGGLCGFNSLSREDPPTPPSGPPSSPCRRGILSDLSRRDPPTPPSGPPPSPRRREAKIYAGLSQSELPSHHSPFDRYDTWTADETDLLILVCKSGVKLVG